MKKRIPHFPVVTAAAVALAQMAFADVIHLKDGTRLEGSILDDRGDSYLVEVQVTRSIKDERLIAKEDIQRIQRERADTAAYEVLAELVPVPDLLTAADYNARILQLKEFLETHPTSVRARDVRAILATYEEEAAVIAAGGVKIDGKLVAADDRAANAYEIDSRIAEAAIRTQIGNGELLAALRGFQALEADFTGSDAWRELLPLMRQVIAAHRLRTRELLDGYDELISRQQTGISRMTQEDRLASERGLAELEAALVRRHDEERKERNPWLTTHPSYKPALEETIRFAEQEIRRLETAGSQPRGELSPGAAWRAAHAAIRSGEEAAISAAISAARTAGITGTYLERLEEAAKR